MGKLIDEYLALRRETMDVAELATLLDRLVDEGRRAWPAIGVPPKVFVRYLATRGRPLADVPPRAADLYLACACAQGIPAALAAFDERYLARVPQFVARAMGAGEVAEEVRQQLQQLLLVGDAARPGRIAEYQGRGTLENWVRAAAARTALNLERAERRHRRAAEGAAAEARLQLPEQDLELLRRRHGPQLDEALRVAFARLSLRDRTILRLHFVERVTIAQIAASYDVHRATVSRWFLAAQGMLFDETRRQLCERLDLTSSEGESLIRALRSRLDITLGALLITPDL